MERDSFERDHVEKLAFGLLDELVISVELIE